MSGIPASGTWQVPIQAQNEVAQIATDLRSKNPSLHKTAALCRALLAWLELHLGQAYVQHVAGPIPDLDAIVNVGHPAAAKNPETGDDPERGVRWELFRYADHYVVRTLPLSS